MAPSIGKKYICVCEYVNGTNKINILYIIVIFIFYLCLTHFSFMKRTFWCHLQFINWIKITLSQNASQFKIKGKKENFDQLWDNVCTLKDNLYNFFYYKMQDKNELNKCRFLFFLSVLYFRRSCHSTVDTSKHMIFSNLRISTEVQFWNKIKHELVRQVYNLTFYHKKCKV